MVEGRHILRVTGYEGSVGSFEIVTAPASVTPPIETQDLAAGEPVTASVPAAFNIDVSGDQLVVVRSHSDLDAVLEIVHPNGESSFVDSSARGGVEVAELTGEGPHLLTVSGYDDSDGSFEVVTAPVQTQELVEGEPVTASAPAVFDVDVNVGELFGFTAEPAHPDDVLTMQVNGPEGFDDGVSYVGSARARGARHGHHRRQHPRCVSDHRHFRRHRERDHRVAPRARAATDRRGRVRHRLRAGGVHVDASSDDLFTFTARPESPDVFVQIAVNDADGLPTGSFASSASPGEPATVSVGGALPDDYQVIVTSSGRTELTATLQSVEAQRIVPGSGPVQGIAPAVFDLDLVDGERRVVIVTPQGDEQLFMETRSPGGDGPTNMYSPGLGEPLVVLLSGAGTHRVRITGTGLDDGSFVIETVQVAGGP